MKYHINCLRKETRALESSTSATSNFSERDNIVKAICDIEILHIVKCMISNKSELAFPNVDTNSIQDAYKLLFEKQGLMVKHETRYKKHIKVSYLREYQE